MWKIAFLFFSIFFIDLFALEPDQSEEAIFSSHSECKGKRILISEKSNGKHLARITGTENYNCQFIDIEYEGKQIYHKEEIGAHFYFGSQLEDGDNPFVYLTNSNSPEFIFTNWTGGAHCCYTFTALSLEAETAELLLATVPSNFVPELEDTDGDDVFEIKVLDDIFAYVFSSFAYSAKGIIILRYINGQYQVSAEDTERANSTTPITLDQIKIWQNLFKEKDHGDFPPPSFIQAITDLFYSGQGETAFQLIDKVWPPDISGKEDFLKTYMSVLNESVYFRKLIE